MNIEVTFSAKDVCAARAPVFDVAAVLERYFAAVAVSIIGGGVICDLDEARDGKEVMRCPRKVRRGEQVQSTDVAHLRRLPDAALHRGHRSLQIPEIRRMMLT